MHILRNATTFLPSKYIGKDGKECELKLNVHCLCNCLVVFGDSDGHNDGNAIAQGEGGRC